MLVDKRPDSGWLVGTPKMNCHMEFKSNWWKIKCCECYLNPPTYQGVWFYKSKKSRKMGSGPGPPEPPECLILEDLQTLRIPTNKKLEVWTQYRLLLSFLGGYFSSFKNIFRQILRNHSPVLIAELRQVAIVVKISQLTQMCTGAWLTGFDCHFDHRQHYKTMLLPVKNRSTHFDL